MLSATIGRALAILAVVGLVVTPLARPVMAMPANSPATAAEQIAPDAAADMAMPADMPCCPEKAVDCKDCPVMGVCMTGALQSPAPSSLVIFATVAGILLPGDEAAPSGFARPPPAKPPKA